MVFTKYYKRHKVKGDEVGGKELVPWMEEMRDTHRVLVGNPRKKTPFLRNIRRREDNIKVNLKEKSYNVWIGFLLVWIQNLHFPYKTWNLFTSVGTICF